MSSALNDAGPLAYLIILGTLLGVVVCAAFGALAFTGRRVPLTGLIAFPYIVLAAGAVGAWASSALVGSAVSAAAPADIPLVAMTGAWGAMAVDWMARWGAAIVLAAGVWAAAAGAAAMPGDEPKFTFVPAGLAGGTAAIGALGLLIYGFRKGLGTDGLALAALVLVVGAGVAVGASRRAQDDHMFRVAGMRFAASMCALLSVFHAARAVDIGNRMTAFAADSALMTATELPVAVLTYDAMIGPGVVIGVAAVALGALIALFGFFTEIVEVVVRYTVFDMFGVAAVMTVVGLFRILESSGFDALYTVATSLPAVETYHEVGPGLPASTVDANEVALVVRLAEGGFGDVLMLEGETWKRTWSWDGSSWSEDHSDLADITLADAPPLLAGERGMPAAKLMEVMDKTADGKVFLLLRASEVKAGTNVPAELARLQVTYLPLRKSTPETRDYKTALWAEAGDPEVKFGPTTWFGEGDDEFEPLTYASAVRTSTSAEGMHVFAKERKVADVVGSCLPFVVDVATEGTEGVPPVLAMSTRWCALGIEDAEAVRVEAAAVTELPVDERLVMKFEIDPVLDAAEVEDRIRRELGGLAWCAERANRGVPPGGAKAPEAPEELKGRMTLNLPVNKQGQVYDTIVDEKSKLQSPAMLRCAGKRFRKFEFTVPPPAPETPPEPGVTPEPPPPPPKVVLHLDFNYPLATP